MMNSNQYNLTLTLSVYGEGMGEMFTDLLFAALEGFV